ncbi:hypothetical protein K504DRAFT_477965 [Pleomassaria siparia CBS 279.74]|uniref:Uncharacterized protein n=1 Tax=Pleomassaria siparia CBS 279.74 TaxID=1314801 RepID=A0A6G1KNQ4_9PLEO|nr:hypothetical protein K504DRAFT_477965 [Pleomassaria siparia CBS 279.74]
MSDYGDDFSDYGDEFFYVEDEYTAADDLAEHAVGSPPPMTYIEEDALADWDRFDYFNDLEYASDGYDDGKFLPQGSKTAKVSEKRKRTGQGSHGRKRQKAIEGQSQHPEVSVIPPVLWRTQAERDPKLMLWDGNTDSYALMKDWRERHVDIPAWATGSSQSGSQVGQSDKAGSASVAELLPPVDDYEDENEEGEEEDAAMDPAVLLAALQSRLAEAGGPLAGMDPQQMLQFAMRMMTNQDAGDDIAGEMTEQLLNQGGEDDGEEEDEDDEDSTALRSWLDKQRQSNQAASVGFNLAETPNTPELSLPSKRPPTPPSSEANRKTGDVARPITRKRKADEDGASIGSSTNDTKRRATRSFDTPTAASQARAASSIKATSRSGRAKRS